MGLINEDALGTGERQPHFTGDDTDFGDTSIGKLEDQVHSLLSDYQKLSHETAALKEANTRLEAENKQLKDKNSEVIRKISALINRVSQIYNS